MIKIKNLTVKNFLSIGAVTQSISFKEEDIILVLGENLDLGGNDNKNGTGKTSIINALSYVMFGEALVKIKKTNLINKINGKNMLVTMEFENNGTTYKIERGRSPNILKFSINDKEIGSSDVDESQGENRLTQQEIERALGMTHTMFKQIIALNTYSEPFLSMSAYDQRDIIEQLLGVTKLSEKSEKLKEIIRIVKDEIKEEEYKIKSSLDSNKRIEENIKSIKLKSVAWENKKKEDIDNLQKEITELLNVDIDQEILSHKENQEIEILLQKKKAISKENDILIKEINLYEKNISALTQKLHTTDTKNCPTCNQSMDIETHRFVQEDIINQINELTSKLDDKKSKQNVLSLDLTSLIVPNIIVTHYTTIDQAYNHKSILNNYADKLEREITSINPYVDQIESLQKNALLEIDYSKLNELNTLRDHQEFLLKILTNKDSFVRKKIIDQNLSFLNHRLSHYLEKIGLPHEVRFKSDLEVEITQYGRDFDFDNLSRGERTRLMLSLSWAFRDVFESLNDKINLLFIDELMDNGLDSSGVESALGVLKKMAREQKRNIFLVSHREELIGRVNSILKVIKQDGFTSFDTTESEE